MRSNMTGGGFYNSEPRNYNRGFGRGVPRQFQPSQRHPSPQPARRGCDLFIEAGKLAVEYLVSRGLLSSNVLSGKYQNGSLRNSWGESQDLRSSVDRDGSRRSSGDLDVTMSRSYSRERRRLGPSRSYSSDWSRENGREGSLTEEAIPARTLETENDTFHKDVTTKETETSFQKSSSAESANKDDKQIELQDENAKSSSLGDLESTVISMVQNKDDEEVVNASDAVDPVFEETKTSTDHHDKVKDTAMDNLAIQHGEEKSNGSSLLNNNASNGPLLINEDNVTETGINSPDSQKYGTMSCLEEDPRSKCLGTAVSDHSFREVGVTNLAYPVDQQNFMRSLPFTDKTFSYEQKASGLPEHGMCSSIAKDRGEKRPIEEDNMMEGAKKAKQQWLSVAQSDEFLQLSNLSDKHSVSPEKRAINIFNVSASPESFTNVSLPLNGSGESNMNQGEKQLLSNSFKICDLNLMEASDIHETHEGPALLYSTISDPSRELPVDIDLTIRNSCSLTNEFNDAGSARKEIIEIIDLESTSLEGCKGPSTSMKNTEDGIASMESFQTPQNSTENPDSQDGYGFMISELLGNDVANCSSVQPDMNSLHNGMGLNHGEGMFSEDDPIYMSLGEIPLTGLLRSWEQPTQERNPFEM